MKALIASSLACLILAASALPTPRIEERLKPRERFPVGIWAERWGGQTRTAYIFPDSRYWSETPSGKDDWYGNWYWGSELNVVVIHAHRKGSDRWHYWQIKLTEIGFDDAAGNVIEPRPTNPKRPQRVTYHRIRASACRPASHGTRR